MMQFLHPVRQAGDWLCDEARKVALGCLDLVAPPICCRCETALDNAHWLHIPILLCDACVAVLEPSVTSTCPRCAAPAASSSLNDVGCWRCRDAKFPFATVTALGVYQNELRDGVLVAKSSQGLFLGNAMGQLLARKLKANRVSRYDLIVATPMHWLRKWRRGINVPDIVAAAISAELGTRSAPLAICDKWIARQSSLPPTERPKNVRNAYRLKSASVLRDQNVLLVDDILTTGATASTIARKLRKAGAARIDVAVLARGIGWA